jgi:hypothetical protein
MAQSVPTLCLLKKEDVEVEDRENGDEGSRLGAKLLGETVNTVITWSDKVSLGLGDISVRDSFTRITWSGIA